MSSFKGVDFVDVDSLLSEEEKLVRQTIREFVNEQVIPIIADCYEDGRFPAHLILPLGELGVYGANLPEEYGCAGMNNVAYGLVMQELERGDSGVRSHASVQGALVMYPIFTYGSEEQKRKWLPLMAKGEKLGCFGLTEAGYGSNPGGMVTTAERVRDGWLLNGSKAWITNGTVADVAVVWAKVDGEIRGFLVEKGTPGYTSSDIHHKLSLRASVTSELFFQDCLIPEENIFPKAQGLKCPLSCLTQARYGIAWGAVGAAMACYHAAVEYSKERVMFDKPIASFQITQQKLAWMLTEITKAQLLVLQLGRLKDRGEHSFAQVSMAKMNNVEKALEIARLARGILGANGITGEYHVMRHACNLESVYTYEGTHEMHTLILGQHITGIPAFD